MQYGVLEEFLHEGPAHLLELLRFFGISILQEAGQFFFPDLSLLSRRGPLGVGADRDPPLHGPSLRDPSL